VSDIDVLCSRGTFNRQGIVPSELRKVCEKFLELELDFGDAAYTFNFELDRWEVFDKSDMTTMITNSGVGWA